MTIFFNRSTWIYHLGITLRGRKSIYELRQASRQWFQKFSTALLGLGFTQSKCIHFFILVLMPLLCFCWYMLIILYYLDRSGSHSGCVVVALVLVQVKGCGWFKVFSRPRNNQICSRHLFVSEKVCIFSPWRHWFSGFQARFSSYGSWLETFCY